MKWGIIIIIGLIVLGMRLANAFLIHPDYHPNDLVRARFNLPLPTSRLEDGYYWYKFGSYWEIPKGFEANQWGMVSATGSIHTRLIRGKTKYIVQDYSHFEFLESSEDLGKILPNFRRQLEQRLMRFLARDEAGLAIGLLFGGTREIPTQVKQAFRTTGLMHIAAASGYNVSLVAGWVIAFAGRFASKKWTSVIAILCIGLYVLLAGATASIVRAGIMAGVVVWGKTLGRESDGLWLLLLTAWLMLLVNPHYLIDIGWQLSFAATFGLVWLKPKAEWQTTLAAQATTMPLIMYHFGQISVVAPLANLAVLWTIPWAMQLLAIGLVLPPILLLASPLLRFVLNTTTWMASWPHASLYTTTIGGWWVIGYYLVLMVIVRQFKLWQSGSFKS